MTIPREERLLNLVALLLNRSCTLEEIRSTIEGYPSELASVRRQFERDKDLLRDIGIRLEIEIPSQGEGEYRYRITQPRLAALSLTPQERAALHLAMVSATMDPQLMNRTLGKLGGKEDGDQEIEAQVALETLDSSQPLWQVIEDQGTVSFQYRGATRIMEPWAFAFRYGKLYVLGYDCDRNAPRVFRLDRIEGSVALRSGIPAAQPRPDQLDSLFDEIVTPPVHVTVLVDRIGAAQLGVTTLVWDEHSDEQWQPCVVAMLDMHSCIERLSACLDHAILMEPLEWREQFIQHLEGGAS